jgi:hypothetical protein
MVPWIATGLPVPRLFHDIDSPSALVFKAAPADLFSAWRSRSFI